MFTTLTQKLLLGIYIFILLSIPIGAYLASESKTIKSRALEDTPGRTLSSATPKPSASPPAGKAGKLLNLIDVVSPAGTPSPDPSPSSAITSTFGPTLSFSVNIEGRPKDNQAARIFVGIVEGVIGTNPKFLLSFTFDLPASGKYSNLSLAGLNPGSAYTALIKGSAQIAGASAFTMSPAVSNLNNGDAVNLLSGDLNDDNVINSADYVIAQKAIGSTVRSSNWNENADINKDGLINVFDLGLITKNIGKTGSSGAWTSPLPKTATSSGNLNSSEGGPEPQNGGYWIWVPK